MSTVYAYRWADTNKDVERFTPRCAWKSQVLMRSLKSLLYIFKYKKYFIFKCLNDIILSNALIYKAVMIVAGLRFSARDLELI